MFRRAHEPMHGRRVADVIDYYHLRSILPTFAFVDRLDGQSYIHWSKHGSVTFTDTASGVAFRYSIFKSNFMLQTHNMLKIRQAFPKY